MRSRLIATAAALTAVLAVGQTALHPAQAETNDDAAGFFGGSLPITAPPQTSTLAPGVTLTSLALGAQDADDYWTVHVYLPATPDGPLATAGTALGERRTADRVAAAVSDKGFQPLIEEVRSPEYADHPAGTVGWTVRVGRYATSNEAATELSRIRAQGFAGGTRYTAQDGTDPMAPQKVHVLRVDFAEFGGEVDADFGSTVSGMEKLTDRLAATPALAGINAQWFYDKASGGLYVQDGKLLGAATQGRGGIAITRGGRKVDVDAYRSVISLRAGAEIQAVDGVNRLPGRIWNCGGLGADKPTQAAQHDLMCTDDSELVQFTPEWGAATPAGAGAEAVVGPDGRVVALHHDRGAAVPEGGTTIQATGALADWLLTHAKPGGELVVNKRVVGSNGATVPLTKGTTILQVGPRLVEDGEVAVTARADGLIREGSDQTFTYNWAVRSNPRSMVGVDAEGRLMLVVVDGRQAGYSEGLGIAQTGELMKLLGATEALNLDGGGSSVLATRDGGIVNRPSDAAGQRSLGNVITVQP